MTMRVLHLTTEFPPVIYGGLGTAVGGWARASAREGLNVGVLLVEGELAFDDPFAASRYGLPSPSQSVWRQAEGRHEGIKDQGGIRFFQVRWPSAPEAG